MTIAVPAATSPLFAQSSTTAQLTGRVVDPGGAGLEGATIRIIDTERNNVHTAVSGSDGLYTLPNLEVAPYRLEVTKAGFKKLVQRAIVLHVGDNREINVGLLAEGGGEDQVLVTSGANLVQTEQVSVSQIVSRKSILELPLNGRQPTQLVLISGASVVAPAGDMSSTKNYPSSTTISVAGGQPNGTNYILDGGTNIDTFSNVNLPLPFPDALAEFSVSTSTLPARDGYLSGGIVSVVTKSGANEFHGNLFEFVRNGIFNAQNRFSTSPDQLKRNQFGGTAGGRVIRDKLFAFAGYQDTRLVSQPGNSFAFVPTAQETAGDFSTKESAQCQASGLPHAPLNGYPANHLNPANFDPAAVKLLQYLPKSTDPCGKVSVGIKAVQYETQGIGRVDWNQGQRHTMYARYFLADFNNPAPDSAVNSLTSVVPGLKAVVNSFTLGDYLTLTPRMLNAFHGTLTRRGDTRGNSPGLITPATLGINIAAPDPADLRVAVTSDFTVGCATCASLRTGVTTFEVSDDVDYIKGHNQFGFGANVLRTDLNNVGAFYSNGVFTFNGANTGDPMADFFLGSLGTFTQSRNVVQALRETVIEPYAQDTLRLNKHLLVTAGLRWEPHFFAHDALHREATFSQANFNAGIVSAVYPNAPAGALFLGDKGVPSYVLPGNKGNFSPRLGIVWDPTGKGRETLRAGGGILYDSGEVFALSKLEYNPPFVNEIDLAASAPGGFSNPYTTGYNYAGGNPFPVTTNLFPLSGAWTYVPNQLRSTRMSNWNLTYQRQVGDDWVFEASYLGNRTNHIWGGLESDPAVYSAAVCAQFTTGCTTKNTNQRRVLYQQNAAAGKYYGSVLEVNDGANASYNGLLVSANHRLTKGVSVLANYTYSHCISEVEPVGDIGANSYTNPSNLRQDNASCGYDVRHIVNASVVETVGPKGNSLLDKVVGQWQFAPLLRATSGIALNVVTGADNSRTGLGLDRPNYSGTASPYASTGNKLQLLNAAAFTPNAIGTMGDVGRNALRGPGALNVDLGLARLFTVKRFEGQFRCDTFNVLNKVNLIAPATGTGIPGISAAGVNLNLASATFGQITSSGDPRIIQLAMKVAF